MPINPYDIGDIPIQSQNPFFGTNNAMQMLSSAIETAYKPSMSQANLGYKKAQTKREEALANLPFGGANLPGVAGQILGMESIARMFGTGSPQYQAAKDAFDLQQASTLSRNNYQNSLTDSMPKRYSTSTGKQIYEENAVGQGYAPGGESWGDSNRRQTISTQPINLEKINNMRAQYRLPPLTAEQAISLGKNQSLGPPVTGATNVNSTGPDSPENLKNQYSLQRIKSRSDTDTRKRLLFANNIDKTIEKINPDSLTMYAGANGFKKFHEQLKAPFGLESKEYDDYKDAVQNVNTLAKQVRQFYGDSIQPSMLDKLESLTNPATWRTNPKLAKKLFNSFVDLLHRETGTYREAISSPEAYTRGNENQGQEVRGNSNPAPSNSSAPNYLYHPKLGKISEKDIVDTAKKYKISPEEVKKKLGIQ